MTSVQSNPQPQQESQKQPGGMPVRSNLRAGYVLQIDLLETSAAGTDVQVTTATTATPAAC